MSITINKEWLLNILVYILALFLLFKAWQAEHLDLNCPYPSSSKEECCGDGCGMAYRGSRPEDGDNIETLLNKIDIASRTEERTVKWRRSYILAVIILILVWLAVFYPIFGGLPKYNVLIVFLFITTMIIYYSFSYYGFHHYEAPMRYIRVSTDKLREKLYDRK